MSANTSPALHNATWPGLVGKFLAPESKGQEPIISLDRMLALTVAACVGERKFDGVDHILLPPYYPTRDPDQISDFADKVTRHGLRVGSLVAPVWDNPAIDPGKGRAGFLEAVEFTCKAASILDTQGVRQSGVIRIDTASAVSDWEANPTEGTENIIETFKQAGAIARAHGQRLAMEGEICWGGIHTWQGALRVLEGVGMPDVVGFQADLAHTYLYLLVGDLGKPALLAERHTPGEFWAAYRTMTDALRPWTIDFHVAQSDGGTFGSGDHAVTGKHCLPTDTRGVLDIVRASQFWLSGGRDRGIQHICWDGCMFPNAKLERGETWESILGTMLNVQERCAGLGDLIP